MTELSIFFEKLKINLLINNIKAVFRQIVRKKRKIKLSLYIFLLNSNQIFVIYFQILIMDWFVLLF